MTDEAKQAFIVLFQAMLVHFRISWQAPSDILLEEELTEPQRAEIKLVPYMQARIVNLRNF